MFTMLAALATRRPWAVIALAALAALLSFAGARNLHFVSDFDSSLPNRSPLSSQIHAIQTIFASRNTLAFLIKDGRAGDAGRGRLYAFAGPHPAAGHCGRPGLWRRFGNDEISGRRSRRSGRQRS
jgi:hypothetical protein